jgi:hypothetical protein
MFVAGGVCLTALGILHRDIATAHNALAMPERFGPFQPWFFYGVIVVELVMMTSFGFAVIKSILHRKNLEDHAWWLISTVFIIMMPALGRGIQGVYVNINQKDWPNVSIIIPLYIAEVLIIGMLFFMSWKYNKLKHPATYLALAVNCFNCFVEPIGRSKDVQSFLESMIKG